LPSAARFCPACGAPVTPPSRGGEERKLVTVLFADLVDSTALGSRLDPEHLGEVTDTYFEAMRQEIEHQGGTVEKFIGDAVMAVFGVPAAHEDDPTRALLTALRMRYRLTDLNRTLEGLHGVTLAMRIGINTGEVLATTHPRLEERMVTGDAVNVAARLEEAAAPGQILASERTIRGARGFRYGEVGPLRLKGKDEQPWAFEVLSTDPAWVQESSAQTPMVGRREEVELLQTLFRRMTADRRPHLVTISGEAGIGKSRLVEEFQAWAQGLERPPTIVRGRCLPYGEGVTYWPLAQILKRRAGVLDSDAPEAAMESIRAAAKELLVGAATDPEMTAAALAVTVGLEYSDSPLRDLEPPQVRFQVASAWRSFFWALAQPDPALVLIEDLHWAGDAMLDLLEELMDRVEAPVVFLCSARRQLITERPGWGARSRNFSRIMLEPLGDEESRRLLNLLLEDEQGVPVSVGDRILERAGGNPFFLEQIVNHLAEERRAAREPVGTGFLEEVDIPDTVQAVLTARIDLLEPLEKRILRSAAVVGKEFWSGPVARLLDGEIPGGIRAVEDVLSGLEDRGLVIARLSSMIEGEREYVFQHILTRDVAYEGLPRKERQQAHARVARWIEQRADGRRVEFADVLSHHYTQAYRLAREDVRQDDAEVDRFRAAAFRYALLASEQARGKLALAAAERQAELAVSLAPTPLDRARALEALGEASFLDSDGDRAWQCLTEAVDLRSDSDLPDRRVLARLCARALEVPTRGRGSMRIRPAREEVAPYLQLGLESAGSGDSEELTRLLIVKAFWASLGGGRGSEKEEMEARKSGEEAEAMAMRLGRPDLASAALDGVGQYYLDRGLAGPWGRLIDRRLELAGSLTDPTEIGDIYATAAWCAYLIGRYGDAERHAGRGAEVTLGVVPSWALYCLDLRAVARSALGNWEGLFDDVSVIGEMLGDRKRPPGYASDHLGAAAFVHEAQGDPAAADRLLEVIAWVEGEEERPSGGLAAWKALLLARRGTFDEAHRALDAAEAMHEYARGNVLEARCELLAEQAAWDEANEVLIAARGWAEEANLLALPCFADRLDGLVARAADDRKRADELLTRALVGFNRLEAEWEAARTALMLAELSVDGERSERAQDLLAAARQVFERLHSVRELVRSDDLALRLV
jgi:class 3 adenylate cyclase